MIGPDQRNPASPSSRWRCRYFSDGYAKVELAVARGRRAADKRQAIAEREAKREAERAVGRRAKGTTTDPGRLDVMSDDAFVDGFWPYRKDGANYRSIPRPTRRPGRSAGGDPPHGTGRGPDGRRGRVSRSLYSGDHDHYRFLGEVFSRSFRMPMCLQRDMYPSATKFEGEIIAMALDLFHGEDAVGSLRRGHEWWLRRV